MTSTNRRQIHRLPNPFQIFDKVVGSSAYSDSVVFSTVVVDGVTHQLNGCPIIDTHDHAEGISEDFHDCVLSQHWVWSFSSSFYALEDYLNGREVLERLSPELTFTDFQKLRSLLDSATSLTDTFNTSWLPSAQATREMFPVLETLTAAKATAEQEVKKALTLPQIREGLVLEAAEKLACYYPQVLKKYNSAEDLLASEQVVLVRIRRPEEPHHLHEVAQLIEAFKTEVEHVFIFPLAVYEYINLLDEWFFRTGIVLPQRPSPGVLETAETLHAQRGPYRRYEDALTAAQAV